MNYLDQPIRVVIIYPDKLTQAINDFQKKQGLVETEIKPLEFGMDEVVRVSHSLDAELVSGHDATIHGLLNVLETHVDILWVITHGVEEGFFLNDGLINASELTSLVRSAGVFLCVLNTCESYEVAHKMASELDVAVLCTVSPVPDRSAFISGTLFARHLAAGMDYVDAWKKASPGQDHPYQLFQARRGMNPRPPRPSGFRPSGSEPLPVEETLQQLESSVAELKRIIYGYPDLGLPPLRQITNDLSRELVALKETMANISRKLDSIEKTQIERNRLIIAVVIGMVVIGLAVGYLILKGS